MQHLGKITNHHLIITDSELNNIVNSLAFFHAIFDPARVDSVPSLIAYWKEVADDTYLPSLETLATKIATLSS